MIRIDKSDDVPQKLRVDGERERNYNNALYDADPAAYQKGKKKFDFKAGIYAHTSVKKQLIREQYGKCCFCEADFTANGYGDVEHFRPKAGYQQRKSDKIKKPGYYWKAYDWDNLFFSCQICNQRYKKNYFPLDDPPKRAICHHDDIDAEKPLLIHPSADEPEEHIGFRDEIPYPKTGEGKKSIEAYGLKRGKLNEVRREYLNHVANYDVFTKMGELTPAEIKELATRFNMKEPELQELINKAHRFMAGAVKSSSPFASMVRCKYPGLPV